MTYYQSVRHYFYINNNARDLINRIKLMISRLKLKKEFSESLFSIQTEKDFTIIQTLFEGNVSVDVFNSQLLDQIDALHDGSYAIALYNSENGVAYGMYGDNAWNVCEKNGSFVSMDSLQIGLLANSKHWKTILGKKLKVPKQEDLDIWSQEILETLVPDFNETLKIDNLFIRKEGFELVLTTRTKDNITLEDFSNLKSLLERMNGLELRCSIHLKKAVKEEGMYRNTFISSHCWDVLSVFTKDGQIVDSCILTPAIAPSKKSFKEQKMILELEQRYNSNVFNNTFLEELSSDELKSYYDRTFKKD